MEAAMAMAGPAMSVASSGLKVGGAIMGGMADKAKYGAEAGRMQVAASEARLRATEIDGAYREELGQTLANLRAIRAGQNANIDSPTSLALEERATDVSTKQSEKAVANEMKKAAQAEQDALMLRKAGRGALAAAYLKAAPDMLGMIQGGMSLGRAGVNAMLPVSSGKGAF